MAPLVARPRVLIKHAVVWTVVLTSASLLGWFALSPDIRALFTVAQVATLIAFLVIMLGIVWLLAASYVRADETGLTYRNGARTHHTPWAEVEGIRFRDGDAWAFVEVGGDLGQRPLLGVMRTDGQRAHELVADLRERWGQARG